MKNLFLSRNKKLQVIVFINVLSLGLTGMVHAQSQNPTKPAITKERAANKPDAKKEMKRGEKKSKQALDKDTGNYKGAQPPQGGRLGQGPDHHE